MKRSQFSRRQFMKGAAAAVAVPYFLPSSLLGAPGQPAPSNRVVMGAIGVGAQGSPDNGSFTNIADVQMVAICDLREQQRNNRINAVNQAYGNTDCKGYWDFQELIARKDIDAIHMAVPDHWHAYISIAAMISGKDVYCQKPLSLTLREGREMIKHARRTARVFSSGSQRVWDDYYNLHALARGTGALGEIKEGHAFLNRASVPCDIGKEGDPPAGFNWDRWLGPAPWAEYSSARHDGGFNISVTNGRTWRCHREYSGGDTTDWGGHMFGATLYAMGLEKEGPLSVEVNKDVLFNQPGGAPGGGDQPMITFTFANGMKVYHMLNGAHTIQVTGTKGLQRGNTVAGAAGGRGGGGGGGGRGGRGGRGAPAHPSWDFQPYHGRNNIYGDFIECVKTRQRPFQDVEVAHRACSMCHLSNIAQWVGRNLKFDPVNEVFIGDEEANRYLDRPKRAPWNLPGA